MSKPLILIAGIIIGLGIAIAVVLSLGEKPVLVEPGIGREDTVTASTVGDTVLFDSAALTLSHANIKWPSAHLRKNKCPLGKKWHNESSDYHCVIARGCYSDSEWHELKRWQLDSCVKGQTGFDTATHWLPLNTAYHSCSWYISIILDTKDGASFRKVSDSSDWTFPEIKDSGRVIRGLLDMLYHQFERERSYKKYQDSARDKAYLMANRWANVCRWIIRDYHMDQDDFLQVIKKAAYQPANLYNKHPKKRKI